MSSATGSANIYARQQGESTVEWLERLVNMGAPDARVAAVTAILTSEQASGN